MTATPELIRAELAEASVLLDEARRALRRDKRIALTTVVDGENRAPSQARMEARAKAELCYIEALDHLVALKKAAEPWLTSDDAHLLATEGRRCEL